MLLNEYFETISFAQGAQFNVSHTIDTDYMNKLHWHPFVEILVSLAEGNAVSVNFCRYELGHQRYPAAVPPAICTASRAAARTRI